MPKQSPAWCTHLPRRWKRSSGDCRAAKDAARNDDTILIMRKVPKGCKKNMDFPAINRYYYVADGYVLNFSGAGYRMLDAVSTRATAPDLLAGRFLNLSPPWKCG
ncbi:MAG: hypothetical protein KDI38_20665, partial [Calditrichaeota bacterium]|nr:hypothetical protein [Calditrichota bacterium]